MSDEIPEERKKYLNEEIRKHRQEFKLPPEISSKKQILDHQSHAYVLHHNKLGDLGRIVVFPHPSGKGSQFNSEILGDKNDPLFEKRRKIFEPLAYEIINRTTQSLGGKDIKGEKAVKHPYNKRHAIPSTVFPCDKCGQIVAMATVDQSIHSESDLQTFATLMYPAAKEYNVPAWVSGHEKDIILNGEQMGESLVMQIYPHRGKPKLMNTIEFNKIFDKLIYGHCA